MLFIITVCDHLKEFLSIEFLFDFHSQNDFWVCFNFVIANINCTFMFAMAQEKYILISQFPSHTFCFCVLHISVLLFYVLLVSILLVSVCFACLTFACHSFAYFSFAYLSFVCLNFAWLSFSCLTKSPLLSLFVVS